MLQFNQARLISLKKKINNVLILRNLFSRILIREKEGSTQILSQHILVRNSWTIFSNHGHVLLCLAREPELLLREVAEKVGITERAVQKIVAELEADGYLVKERIGRRNRYEIVPNMALRHELEKHKSIKDLIEMLE